MSSNWNSFCGEVLIQSWDIDGVKNQVKRICFNLDMLFGFQVEFVDNEIHLVLNFAGMGEGAPTFILRGEDAKRFLRATKVEIPLEWLHIDIKNIQDHLPIPSVMTIGGS